MAGTDAPPSAAKARGRRRMALGATLSVAVHVMAGLAILAAQPRLRALAEPPVLLTLAAAASPPVNDPQPAAPVAAPKVSPQPTPPQPDLARRSIPRPRVARPDTLPASDAGEDEAPTPAPSEAQVAGAALAGSGAGRGGGPCDMGARVQAALRGDPLVRASAAAGGAAGQALWVWNGDWVRTRGQDGKGLAAVREAILWEVAFAPVECRTAAMHGLLLVTLDPADGGRRLLLGAPSWRWADLLHPRRDPGLEADAAGLRPAAR